jgi:uncharacterized protein
MSNILGIFAKHPIAGEVKTRLGKQIGLAEAAELYESFLRDVLQRFESTADRRVIGIAPATDESRAWFAQFSDSFEVWTQPAGMLGQRIHSFFMAHAECDRSGPLPNKPALNGVFGAKINQPLVAHSNDDSRVVLIGSDSPSIPKSYIADAFAALDSHDCVIGPATDGGYYLIGLRSVAVSADLFDDIEWSTSFVLKQTVSKIAAARLSLAVLPVWYDVDSAEGLNLLSGHIASAQITQSDSNAGLTELTRTSDWLTRHGY